MSNFFNKAFKVGFLSGILIFAVLNIRSYLPLIQELNECMDKRIIFTETCNLPAWGFPFFWNDKSFRNFEEFGGILNIFVVFFGSIALGILFRYLDSFGRRTSLKN